MQAVLGLNPSWEEQPDVLRRNLSQEFSTAPITSMATSSIVPGHGFLSDCSDSASLGTREASSTARGRRPRRQA